MRSVGPDTAAVFTSRNDMADDEPMALEQILHPGEQMFAGNHMYGVDR